MKSICQDNSEYEHDFLICQSHVKLTDVTKKGPTKLALDESKSIQNSIVMQNK